MFLPEIAADIRLLDSLHGSGLTILVPGFGCDSNFFSHTIDLSLSGEEQPLSCSVAPILFPHFFGGCPSKKMVFPKKGSLFFQGH